MRAAKGGVERGGGVGEWEALLIGPATPGHLACELNALIGIRMREIGQMALGLNLPKFHSRSQPFAFANALLHV